MTVHVELHSQTEPNHEGWAMTALVLGLKEIKKSKQVVHVTGKWAGTSRKRITSEFNLRNAL